MWRAALASSAVSSHPSTRARHRAGGGAGPALGSAGDGCVVIQYLWMSYSQVLVIWFYGLFNSPSPVNFVQSDFLHRPYIRVGSMSGQSNCGMVMPREKTAHMKSPRQWANKFFCAPNSKHRPGKLQIPGVQCVHACVFIPPRPKLVVNGRERPSPLPAADPALTGYKT